MPYQNRFARDLQKELNLGKNTGDFSVSAESVDNQSRYVVSKKGVEGAIAGDWWYGSAGALGMTIKQGRRKENVQAVNIVGYIYASVDPTQLKPKKDFDPELHVVTPMQRLAASLGTAMETIGRNETPQEAYVRVTTHGAPQQQLPPTFLDPWRPQGQKVTTDMEERIQLIVGSITGITKDVERGGVSKVLDYIELAQTRARNQPVDTVNPNNANITFGRLAEYGFTRTKTNDLKPQRMFPGGVQETGPLTTEILLGRGVEGTPKSTTVIFGNTLIDAYVQEKSNKGMSLRKIEPQPITSAHPTQAFAVSSILFPGETQPRVGQLQDVLHAVNPYAGAAITYNDKRLAAAGDVTFGFDRRYVTQNFPIEDLKQLIEPAGKTRFEFENDLIGRTVPAGTGLHLGNFLRVKDPSNPSQTTERVPINAQGAEKEYDDKFMGVEHSMNDVQINGVRILLPAKWNPLTGKTDPKGESTAPIARVLEKMYSTQGITVDRTSVDKVSIIADVTAFNVGAKWRGTGIKAAAIETGRSQVLRQFGLDLDVTAVHGEIKGGAIAQTMGFFGARSLEQMRSVFSEYAGLENTKLAAAVSGWVDQNTRYQNEAGEEIGKPLDLVALGEFYTAEAKRQRVPLNKRERSGIELANAAIEKVFFNNEIASGLLSENPRDQARITAEATNKRHLQDFDFGFVRDAATGYSQASDVTEFAFAQLLDNMKHDQQYVGKTDDELNKIIEKEQLEVLPGKVQGIDEVTQRNKGLRRYGTMFYQLTPEYLGGGSVNPPELENFRQYPDMAKGMGLHPDYVGDEGPQKKAWKSYYAWYAQTNDALQGTETQKGWEPKDAYVVDEKAASNLSAIFSNKEMTSDDMYRKIMTETGDRSMYFPKTGFSLPKPSTASEIQYNPFGEDIGAFSKHYRGAAEGLIKAESENDFVGAQVAVTDLWKMAARNFNKGNAAKQAQNRDVEFGASVRYASATNLHANETYTPPNMREFILRSAGLSEKAVTKGLRRWEREAEAGELYSPTIRIPDLSQILGIAPSREVSRAEMVRRGSEEEVTALERNPQNRNTVFLSLPVATSFTQGDLDKDIALLAYNWRWIPPTVKTEADGTQTSKEGYITPIKDAAYALANQRFTHTIATATEKGRFSNRNMYESVSAMYKNMEDMRKNKDPFVSKNDLSWGSLEKFQENFKTMAVDSSIKMGIAYNVRNTMYNSLALSGYSKKETNQASEGLISMYQVGLDKWNIGPKGVEITKFLASSRFEKKVDADGKEQINLISSVTDNKQRTTVAEANVGFGVDHQSITDINNWLYVAADVATRGIDVKGVTNYPVGKEVLSFWFAGPKDRKELLGRLSAEGVSEEQYGDIVQKFITEKNTTMEESSNVPIWRMGTGVATARELLAPPSERTLGNIAEQNPEMVEDWLTVGNLSNLEKKEAISGLGIMKAVHRLGKVFGKEYKTRMSELPWDNKAILSAVQMSSKLPYNQMVDMAGGLAAPESGNPYSVRPSELAPNDRDAKKLALVNRIKLMDEQTIGESNRLIPRAGFAESTRGTKFHTEAETYAKEHVKEIFGRFGEDPELVTREDPNEYKLHKKLTIGGIEIRKGTIDTLIKFKDGTYGVYDIKTGEGYDEGIDKATLQVKAYMLQLEEEGKTVSHGGVLFKNRGDNSVANFWNFDSNKFQEVRLTEDAETDVLQGATRALMAQAGALEEIPDKNASIMARLRTKATKGKEVIKQTFKDVLNFIEGELPDYLSTSMEQNAPESVTEQPRLKNSNIPVPLNKAGIKPPADNSPSPTDPVTNPAIPVDATMSGKRGGGKKKPPGDTGTTGTDAEEPRQRSKEDAPKKRFKLSGSEPVQWMPDTQYERTMTWLRVSAPEKAIDLSNTVSDIMSGFGFSEGTFGERLSATIASNPDEFREALVPYSKALTTAASNIGDMGLRGRGNIIRANEYARDKLSLPTKSPDMQLLSMANQKGSPLNEALTNLSTFGGKEVKGLGVLQADLPLNKLPISENYGKTVEDLTKKFDELGETLKKATKYTEDHRHSLENLTKKQIEIADLKTQQATTAASLAQTVSEGPDIFTLKEERAKIAARKGQPGGTLGDEQRISQINRRITSLGGKGPQEGPEFDEEGNPTGREMFASWGSAARKVFGGFGLMYMRNIANIATQGLGKGLSERTAGDMRMAQIQAQRFGVFQVPRSQKTISENYAAAFGAQWSPETAWDQAQYEQPGLTQLLNTGISGVAAAGATAWLSQSTMGMILPGMTGEAIATATSYGTTGGLIGPATKVATKAATVGGALAKAIPWVAAAVIAGQAIAGTYAAYRNTSQTAYNRANNKPDLWGTMAYMGAELQSFGAQMGIPGADAETLKVMDEKTLAAERVRYQLSNDAIRKSMINPKGDLILNKPASYFDIPTNLTNQEKAGYATAYYQDIVGRGSSVPEQFLAQASGWAAKNQEFMSAYGKTGTDKLDYLENLASRYMLSPMAEQYAVKGVGAVGGNIADLYRKGVTGTGTDLLLNTKDVIANYIAGKYDADTQDIIGAGFDFMAATPGIRYLEGIGFNNKTGKIDVPKMVEFGERMGILAGTPEGDLWQARMAVFEQGIKAGKKPVAPKDTDYVTEGGRWEEVLDNITKTTSQKWIPEKQKVYQGTPEQIEALTVEARNTWQITASMQETRDTRSINAGKYGTPQMQTNMQNWFQEGINKPEEFGFREFIMSRSPAAIATTFSMGQGSRTMTTDWGQYFNSSLLAGDISATTGMPTGLNKYATSWINGDIGGDIGRLSGMGYQDPRNLAAMNKAGLERLLPGYNATTGSSGGKYADWLFKPVNDLNGNPLGGFQQVAWNQEMFQHESTMTSLGFQLQGQQAGMAFQTGVGLGAYAGTINPQTGQPFNANFSGGGMWGIQNQQIALQNAQQQWSFGMQQKQMNLSVSQFGENMALTQKGAQMQRGWAKEDWAYNTQVRELGWQWKQEDFQEENRFLTGRQRRLSERQMGRDTIMYDLEGNQIEKQKNRQKESWKLEDERFAVQKKQFQESLKLQQEQLEKAKEFYAENFKLQQEQLELSRAYYIVQQDLQKKSTEFAMGQEEKRHSAALTNMTAENKILEDQALALNASQTSWALLEDSFTALNNLVPIFNANLAETIILMGGTPPTSGDDPTLPPTGRAAGGYKEFETFGGVEFVMNQMATSAAEQAIGGPLTQRNIMGAMERSRYIENGSYKQGGGSPSVINIYIGNEKLSSFILDTVTKELRS